MTTPEEMRGAIDKFGPAYDQHVTPFSMGFGEEAVRRLNVRPGERVLDVAAGGGAFAIPAARAGGHVLATDISPVMLERLEQRARDAGVTDIETRVMDGHQLELEDATFDVSASQFGIMLFPDRPRALGELARVTKPGGRGAMVVFGQVPRVELFSFFMQAMRAALPGFTPPPDFPLFVLQDPEKLRGEMTEAGFSGVRVDIVDRGMEVASGAQIWELLTSAAPPIAAMVVGLPEDRRAAIRASLEEQVRERAVDGTAILNMQANIGVGVKEQR
jgi:ubiquinone/menaquinone biosynthesis C-methylase UbiE